MPIRFNKEGVTYKEFEKRCKENVLIFAVIGLTIGYFTSDLIKKRKK